MYEMNNILKSGYEIKSTPLKPLILISGFSKQLLGLRSKLRGLDLLS